MARVGVGENARLLCVAHDAVLALLAQVVRVDTRVEQGHREFLQTEAGNRAAVHLIMRVVTVLLNSGKAALRL
jgi:hypothetical protein